MKKQKVIVLFLLFLMICSTFYARTSNPDKILEIYTEEQIQEKFGEVRFSEWVDDFEIKKDGIYFLTEKWQYLTYINDDGSLYFSGIQSRYEYNQNEIAHILLWIMVISAIIIAIVILSSVKWHGFKWYKRLHGRQ